jgi:hypothetical protein
MANDLTASNLTVVVTERWIEGVKRHSRGTLTLAGTLEYPTGGILLDGPTAALTPSAPKRFGMDRQLDVLMVNGDNLDLAPGTTSTTSFVYQYNPVTKALVLYEGGTATTDPLTEASNARVPGRRSLRFYAIGW